MASRPNPVTSPISFIPRELLMQRVIKVKAVVKPPVIIPLPLLRKVVSRESCMDSPAEENDRHHRGHDIQLPDDEGGCADGP